MSDLDLHGVSLAQAVNAIAGKAGVHITVNWKALEPSRVFHPPGNFPDRQVDARLRDITLERALDVLFCDGRPQDRRVVFESGTKEINVTSAEAADLLVRVYYVRTVPPIEARQHQPYLGFSGDKTDTIVKLAEEVVNHDMWGHDRGSPCYAVGRPEYSVVVSTAAVHREIRALLDEFGRAINGGPR